MLTKLRNNCKKLAVKFWIPWRYINGWILDEILYLDLNMAKYTQLKGSSYIPLPKKLKTKKAIINVKNTDNKCFLWSILAALHPAAQHVDRQPYYMQFENELDFNGV
jgi:hypothetical protein